MSNTCKHEEKISGKPKSTLHIICSLVKKKKPYATQASAESDQSLSESSDTSLTPDSFDHCTDSREETLQFPIRQISVRSNFLTTLLHCQTKMITRCCLYKYFISRNLVAQTRHLASSCSHQYNTIFV